MRDCHSIPLTLCPASDTPSIISHTDMAKYFYEYAVHNNLFPRIQLNTSVHTIEPLSLSQGTDAWKIVYSRNGGSKEEIVVDKVVISTGVYTLPRMPKVEGLELFEGKVKHSQNVKRFALVCLTRIHADHDAPIQASNTTIMQMWLSLVSARLERKSPLVSSVTPKRCISLIDEGSLWYE